MHAGQLQGSHEREPNGVTRVYRELRSRRGEWVDGWSLSIAARTVAVGTRVSELRHRLREHPEARYDVECERRGSRYWYRLRSRGGVAS